ncbi:DUF1385 domain-containing protein [Candidatus Bipolaricaulota bacterium]|nr:DUF1385 domain-containing protein [Candidatus Bipolaricaulota bacterium]MBS3792498.1 DUF1385 domain-containing protein [Candidatus Bipolaricaulota bacterium]
MPVGGQAVIEGVLMRNEDDISVAVRRVSDGEVVVRNLEPRKKFKGLSGVPFIRGLFNLYDMLSTGIRALNLSAEIALEEEEEDFGAKEAILTTGLALLISIGFFVILPVWATNNLWGLSEANAFLFNLVEGLIRIGLFLLYLVAITFFEDIKRVFEYHGAEHKSVYAYEDGKELAVDEAKGYSTLHPRCGTAFLMIVLVVAILTFSLVGNPPILIKIASRILLLPVVAGVSYEILRFSGRHTDNPFLRPFLTPGLMLQKITTREPSEDQIEVALAALKQVVGEDKANQQASD